MLLELFAGLSLALAPFADVYVDQSAPTCPAGTGAMNDPVCTVTDALGIAAPGDRIHIAAGTYSENLVLGFDVELIGTSGAATTVLDGGNSGRVIEISSMSCATIRGLTITNGRYYSGAGILVNGDLQLVDSVVTENTGDGGLFGSAFGGGIAVFSAGTSVVTITNSTVSNNTLFSEYEYGGGVFAVGAQVTITDSTISGNRSLGSNPGFYRYGGGIGVRSSDLTLNGCVVEGNESHSGGGVWTRLSTLVMTNSTVSGNSAVLGGGLNLADLQAGSSISSVTVARNGPTTGSVGGITTGGEALSVHNSIVAGNHVDNPLSSGTSDLRGSFLSLGHNLIGTGDDDFTHGVLSDLVGSEATPIDPVLGPLQDNGGATRTHALLFGSPAIDAGDPVSFEPLDQRGNPRPVELGPDIGAFESEDTVVQLCHGNGGDQLGCTDCPCSNNAAPGTPGGCLNSAGSSARLYANGSPSVSLPAMSTHDIQFKLFGGPPSSYCVLVSGHEVAPASMSNPCFAQDSGVLALAYDGLRCSILSTRRHGGRSANVLGEVGVTNNPWGGPAPPDLGIAQAFGGFFAGQVRYFQSVYRDSALSVCMRGLNTTQSIEVTFTP